MLQLDDWSNCLEKGGQTDATYSNFEKALDKVPHRRLISKLHFCIIRSVTQVLIGSWIF